MVKQSPNSLPDVSRGPTVLAISWTTTTVAIIIVSLRLYMRLKHHAHGWDDYLIYLALGMSIDDSILQTLQVSYGFGKHILYVNPSFIPQVLKYTSLAEMQNGIGTFLVKISVAVFILRLIKGTHRNMRIVILFFMVTLLLITLGTLLAVGLHCIPYQKTWDPALPGSCYNAQIVTQCIRVLGAIGTATDFVCVLIPALVIRELQLDRRTKYEIIGVLALGLVAGGCGIGKSVTVEIVSPDFTYDYVPVEIWALVEEHLGVAAASLPTLRPLFVSATDWLSPRFASLTSTQRTFWSKRTVRALGHSKDPTRTTSINSDTDNLVPGKGAIAVKTLTQVELN